MADDLIVIDIEKLMFTTEGKIKLTINTEVNGRELVALFGSSGSGKTTLLRILAGLTKPDRGFIKFGNNVWFDSKNKINLTPQARNISLMFQDYALFPNMTVEQNIHFAQTIKDFDFVNNLISTFGLSEFIKRKPNQLSGGQKQRLALARALARKPDLLLLDEPLSSIDFEMRLTLQDEIVQAHELSQGTTIIVSHDVNEVCRLATKVLCLDNGTITYNGTPDKVFIDRGFINRNNCDNGYISKIRRNI
jgi:molybdate transport system ATP-binding protein